MRNWRVVKWFLGEVCTVPLSNGTATLMRDGMVIIREGKSTDGIPIELCRQELIDKFEKELSK